MPPRRRRKAFTEIPDSDPSDVHFTTIRKNKGARLARSCHVVKTLVSNEEPEPPLPKALSQATSIGIGTDDLPEVASPLTPCPGHPFVEDDSFLDDSMAYLDGEADSSGSSSGILSAIPKYMRKLLYGAIKRIRSPAFDLWLPQRQSDLNRLFRHDSRGQDHTCASCAKHFDEKDQVYRCCDCSIERVLCRNCIRREHAHRHLDRIEVWSGSFWKKETLFNLGDVLYLGHKGTPCTTPSVKVQMTVMHVNGFHHVWVVFCLCSTRSEDIEDRNQLLDIGWFPATVAAPRTAFTFASLDLFLHNNNAGKLSVDGFCRAMGLLTDNIRTEGWTKRYEELSRAIRWYSHLLSLKRAGRGHDPRGVSSTQPGELGILCTSCPHPGINLPENWETLAAEKPWLYAQFDAIDANFRLCQKARGFNPDETLGPGWSYFVDPTFFARELTRVLINPTPPETSTCDSSHNALEQANTRSKEGWETSGVGAVICSRSGMVRPNGVVDLQKGEKYINIDCAYHSATTKSQVKERRISYDIACQWSRNLLTRSIGFAGDIAARLVRPGLKLIFGIPKFHLPAHGDKCQSPFSLNFVTGWARVDGEAIERVWAILNSFATSTREMAAGKRHDFLDAKIEYLNWQKVVNMGTSLSKKFVDAVDGARVHAEALTDATNSIPPESIEAWTEHIAQWQRDHKTLPDPYLEPPPEFKEADVRRELAKEDADELGSNEATLALHNTSPSAFISQGLDLEDMQRALRTAAKAENGKKKLAASVAASLQENRTILQRQTVKWTLVQTAYMPEVVIYRQEQALSDLESSSVDALRASLDKEGDGHLGDVRAEDEDGADDWEVDDQTSRATPIAILAAIVGPKPEEFQLLLPSQLPSHLQSVKYSRLHEAERRLRIAKLESSLRDLKRLLRIKAAVYNHKTKNNISQKGCTRAHSIMQRFTVKITATAQRYRENRKAMLVLDPDGSWRDLYKVLREEDIRTPQEDSGDIRVRLTTDNAAENEEQQDSGSDSNITAFPDTGRGRTTIRKRKRKRGEGHRKLSWIWCASKAPAADSTTSGLQVESGPSRESDDDDNEPLDDTTDEEIGDALRVEWAKTHARAGRWNEELELVVEEMRRVLAFHGWKAKWWFERADMRTDLTGDELTGSQAYAAKQAFYWGAMADKFRSMWTQTLTTHSMSLPW